jgi:hypothetical protein
MVMICNTSATPTQNLERGSLGWRSSGDMGYRGGWLARCNATETGWPRYDGKVGSTVAGRLRCAASQAAEMQRWRSGDNEMWFPWRPRPFGGRTNARDAGQAAAAAGGGGGARPDLTTLGSFSPVFFFSRVIKSKVSGVGARVGRGERRSESRW